MNRTLYILISLCCILLTSCEDMYHKLIEYNGPEEDPVLCLNAEILVGQPVKVYVTRSWFFLDKTRNGYAVPHRGVVSDATVEMQINDGEWKPLTFVHVNDTVIDMYVQEGKSYYTCSEVFKAGDKVSIRANHPNFNAVSATDIVPIQPTCTVMQGEQKGMVLPFTFDVDALPVSNGEVIFFSVKGYGHMTDTMTYVQSSGSKYAGNYRVDTVTLVHTWHEVLFPRIYSDDFIFSEYKLPKTNHGLYTQKGPLYTSADHFTEATKVTLLLDCDKVMVESDFTVDTLDVVMPISDEYHRSAYLDSVVIDVRLALYANRSGSSSYAPEISLYSTDTDEYGYGDFFEELSELFNELGAQEGTQIYSNVEGGFGHFCFINHSSITIPYTIKLH